MAQVPNGPGMSPLERFRRSGGWGGGTRASDPAAAQAAPAAPAERGGPASGPGQPGSLTAGPGGPPTQGGTRYPRPIAVPDSGEPGQPAEPTGALGMAGVTRLSPHAVAVPALASNVRPALVLREREARGLLAEARRHDVGVGGSFSAGPAGIQVWSGPFDGPGGSHGSAVHLGSVDWIYDTPVRYYATIYRAMVTAQGIAVQHNPHTILESVLRLTGLTVEGTRLTMPMPPPRDPFRRRA